MSETPGLAVACRRCFSDRSVPPFARTLFFLSFPSSSLTCLSPLLSPHRAHSCSLACSQTQCVLVASAPGHGRNTGIAGILSFFLHRTPKFKATNDAMEDGNDLECTCKCIAEIEIDGGRDPGHGPAGQLNQAQRPMESMNGAIVRK